VCTRVEPKRNGQKLENASALIPRKGYARLKELVPEQSNERPVAWASDPTTALAMLALPISARADCGVTASGIPNDVLVALDVDHVRQSLADVGIGIGGYTVNEGFGNVSGGIHQGDFIIYVRCVLCVVKAGAEFGISRSSGKL
jgi:hypothetical protein